MFHAGHPKKSQEIHKVSNRPNFFWSNPTLDISTLATSRNLAPNFLQPSKLKRFLFGVSGHLSSTHRHPALRPAAKAS